MGLRLVSPWDTLMVQQVDALVCCNVPFLVFPHPLCFRCKCTTNTVTQCRPAVKSTIRKWETQLLKTSEDQELVSGNRWRTRLWIWIWQRLIFFFLFLKNNISFYMKTGSHLIPQAELHWTESFSSKLQTFRLTERIHGGNEGQRGLYRIIKRWMKFVTV